MSAGRAVFTTEARAGLLARVELGVPFEDAAAAAGVRPNTAKSWLARGRREASGEYVEFAAAVDGARERARAARLEPMGEDELARVVSGLARSGSVAAAKLRWEMLRAPRAGAGEVPPSASKIDELARRRRQAGGAS